MPRVGAGEESTIQNLPASLDVTLDYKFPDALWITFERHSDHAYTINVLDLDYSYTVWLASLSLDERWTLSPRQGPWQGKPVYTDEELF